MDEEVINDLYSRAKSKGYSKSREEFVNLLHNDSEVVNDSYSYVKSKGYGKDINSFNSLIGKVQTEKVPSQKKKFASESSLEDGSLASQKSPKFPELTQEGLEKAMKKRTSVPTDMSGKPLLPKTKKKVEQTQPNVEYKEEDYFTGGFGNTLRNFDEIVPLGIGDFVDDMARSVSSGYRQGTVAETADNLLLQGHKATPEQIEKFIEANKQAQQIKPSEEMDAYNKIYNEEGKGFWGVIKGLANNPSIIPEVLSSSLTSMATNTHALTAAGSAIGAGATYGSVTGAAVTPEFVGAGAIPGAISGAAAAVPYAFGLASTVVETGSTFAELLTEELKGKELTKENVRNILENPETLKSIRNKAISRGIIIGTVDALTGKLASGVGAKILSKSAAKSALGAATKQAIVKSTAAGSAIESLGGAAGEAAARGAIGQDMDVSEIALEGLAELPGGVRSTIQARFAKPTYKVNGAKVRAEDVDELINTMTPQQLASTKIDIKNDYEGREFKIRDKVLTHSVKEEVRKANPNLNEPSLNAITTLEKELQNLEGNKTQTGKDKSALLRNQIKDIQENQLEEETVAQTVEAITAPEETQKRTDRIEELENVLSPEAETQVPVKEKIELEKELETLKTEENAIQKQTTNESVLRTEQPELGLQGMVEGNAKPEGVTTEETITNAKPEEVRDYKTYFDQDVPNMTVQENNGEFLIGNYTPASEGNNPSMKTITDLDGNPLTFKTKEEAQAKLDEVKRIESQPIQQIDLGLELEENPLRNIDTTSDALLKIDYEGKIPLSSQYDIRQPKEISEEYHKAKVDGSNPELVKAVEDLLPSKPTIQTNQITQENGTTNEVQPEPTGDGGARRTAISKTTPLEGAPTIQGATGPDPQLVSVAEKYAAENGINLKRQGEYVEVDEDRAKRISDAYEEMANDPQNPRVKKAYVELIKQTKAQYQALVDAGYKFWFIDLNKPDNVDYVSSPFNSMRDLRQNKQMGVFPTEAGFGSNQDVNVSANPLLEDTGFMWPSGGLNGEMMPVNANDLFRAVHDAFGHGLEGAGFRAQGEENAWQAHSRLYTGDAIGAMTSETRGQNSWVNYGPYGEQNRTASANDTRFADQKAGLMPEFTWTEGLASDMASEEVAVAENLSQGLSEADLPGYDRMISEVEGIVEKSKKRRVSEPKMLDNVMSYVMGSKVYENATDVQREALVRDVRKRFGLREKSAPSVARLFGKIKDVKKITMTEKAALIKQIKDKIKGAKDAIKAQKEVADQIAQEVKELSYKGKITLTQAANIVSRFSKLNLLKETSVSNFVDYMTKVFADAEYDNKINIAKSKIAQAKKNIVTKLGLANGLISPLQKLFSIKPTLIPEKNLNKYLEVLDMLAARQQVLTLDEKSVLIKDVQDILDEINNEQSLSDELADRFEYSENKVFKDGVLDYSASVKSMLKNEEIDENEAELMVKYKDRIVEKEERVKMTEQEIEAEKEVLTKEIKNSTVNAEDLPTRNEKELAKKFNRLIKGDAIKELTNTELKNILKLIDNINNGYLPHYTQLMVEKINSINNSKVLEKSVEKSKLPVFSTLYAKAKSLLTKKDAVLEMVRRNPLFYIDQVIGDFKTKDVFNSILKESAEGEANFTAEFKKVKERLNKAQDSVAKSFKLNPNKILKSSFKMMAYSVQLEYESNVGNKEVNPAAEYLKATIKHINSGKSQFGERDAKALQEIYDEFTDSEGNIDNKKLYNSFNSAEKNAIKTVRYMNESLSNTAEYTSSIIRGQKINPLTNYIHLNVLHEHKPSDLTSGPSFADNYNNSLRPSTKAKSLVERTGKVSPLNFDIFSSAERGAKFLLMDYNLTEPIRTARKTLNRTISNLEKNGKMSKENRKVINAINAAVEESVENLLTNSYTSTSIGDDVVDYISKQGYRSVLAGTGRFAAELLSNIGFIVISDPSTFAEGIKNFSTIMSPDASQIMQNVNSKETNRIFPTDMLSGRLVDTSILSQTTGVKGAKTKNAVSNKLEQFWNRTGKKYKNGVELTADFLISTPDKVVMRPIWFGAFANQFEKTTGKKIDFKKIAQNDEAYMDENREAIEESKNIADERSIITGASANAFTGILKGTSKPNQSTTIKAFNNFNNFMSKFLIYEYVTARTGIYAAMGNGSLSRRQGIALLGAATTRMTVYSLLAKALGSGLVGLLFDDDDDEEEKSKGKQVSQALASTFTSMLLGRDFGNSTKTLVNYGIEKMNEEYLQALRDGDYDPYKDSLQYSTIPAEQEGKQTGISDFIMKMSGSFGPALNTTNLVIKKIYEPKKKTAEAIARQQKEINTRIPLEVLGNLGYIPLYKDIRKSVMKDMYKDLEKGGKLDREKLKKTNPRLYEKLIKMEEKFSSKEFKDKLEEKKKRMEERLKERLAKKED